MFPLWGLGMIFKAKAILNPYDGRPTGVLVGAGREVGRIGKMSKIVEKLKERRA